MTYNRLIVLIISILALLLIAPAAFAQTTQQTERRVVRRVTTTTTTTAKRSPYNDVTPVRRYYRLSHYRTPRRIVNVRANTAPIYPAPPVIPPTIQFQVNEGVPQVYRYVRRPRYVWQPYVAPQNIVVGQAPETIYIYNNTEYVVEEEPTRQPDLECPRNTVVRQAPYRSWCATRRGTMHGPYVTYYQNGRVRAEGMYAYGEKSGAWVEYYDDGGIRAEGEYQDGQRVGTWINYDRNGQESTTVFYTR